jgi:hypothetical protein
LRVDVSRFRLSPAAVLRGVAASFTFVRGAAVSFSCAGDAPFHCSQCGLWSFVLASAFVCVLGRRNRVVLVLPSFIPCARAIGVAWQYSPLRPFASTQPVRWRYPVLRVSAARVAAQRSCLAFRLVLLALPYLARAVSGAADPSRALLWL